MRRITTLMVSIVVLLLASKEAPASVQFFVNPGQYKNLVPATLDLGFQAALTQPFSEIDFEGYQDRAPLDSIAVGALTIGLDSGPTNTHIYRGSFDYRGVPNEPGTINGNTLLSGMVVSGQGVVWIPTMSFDFSLPVEGFGAWIFDNGTAEDNRFVMKATELNGTEWLSGILDSNNLTYHAIDGFLGVVSTSGLKRVDIYSYRPNGEPSTVPFEIDNVQVSLAPIPEPASIVVWGMLLAGVALAAGRRYRRNGR